MYNESWSNTLGNNFTKQQGIYNDMMQQKNIETDGSYQASVSGMYGEFTIAAVLKSLPSEYAVINDVLIQTGIQFRKYSLLEYKKYGETPWELVTRTKDKKYKPIKKELALNQILSNPNIKFYEVVKKSSQLDHIVVSPYGLFIIETKNHKGYIFGDENSKVWTQTLTNGAHYTFFNPVIQNNLHLQHLSNNLKLPLQYMVGMIVFTNPEAYLGNINCRCCYTLDVLYEAILSYTNTLWTPKQTEQVIKAIDKLNSSGYMLAQEHIKYTKDLQYRHEINRMYTMGKR